MLENIEGAIFDMDGTLVDSMWVWYAINKDFLAKRNLPVPADLKENIETMTFRESAKYFKDRFHIDDSIETIMGEWNDMAKEAYAKDVKLKPGVLEYLTLLKENEIKIGLATSNHSKIVDITLKQNGIEHFFDAISTIDEVEREKNFPDIYLLTAKKLNVAPENCIVFEDILPAIKGAKLAGMTVVAVQDEYSMDRKDDIMHFSDRYIEKYDELTKAGAMIF
ncbi:MAG: HAD family hydrolase [Clostridiaceae bacterium]